MDRASALWRISFTRVDLPLPLTPVTQMKTPNGNVASIFLRLCSSASLTVRLLPFPVRRSSGVLISSRPERYLPVRDLELDWIWVGDPAATTLPPSFPAPGPRS